MPKPRRAQLTGKWLSLRSSRRAAPSIVDSAAQAMAAGAKPSDAVAERSAPPELRETVQSALATKPGEPGAGAEADVVKPTRSVASEAAQDATPAGSSARIDIARLTEAVADLGKKKSRRRRYGEGVLPTEAPSGPAIGAGGPTRLADRGSDDEPLQGRATARRGDARQEGILPALADPLDDHESERAGDEPEHAAAARKNIGARIFRGVLVFGLAGLAIAAITALPRV